MSCLEDLYQQGQKKVSTNGALVDDRRSKQNRCHHRMKSGHVNPVEAGKRYRKSLK